MSTATTQREAQGSTNSDTVSPVAPRSAAHALTDPSLLIASLGLACLYAVSQGMRITTLAGIYPVESSLLLRHALAVVALLAVAAMLCSKRFPPMGKGAAGYGIICTLLCLALLARYSSLFVGDHASFLSLGGKLAEEALCCLAVLFWVRPVLAEGLVRMGTTVAYAFMGQAAIQLLLSFLQRIPCALVLCLLPLVSIGLYAKYLSMRTEPAAGTEEGAAKISETASAPLCAFGLAAGVVFCLSFILGGVIFESLEAQNAMADEPLSQLCIIGGNVAAAFVLLFAAPHIGDRSYCVILLLSCFACCAVSLYLTTFLVDETVGGYLLASSVGLQGTRMLIWYAPFLIASARPQPLLNYVLLCATFSGAKVLSSACMLLQRTFPSPMFNVLISLAIMALFCCCALIIVRNLGAPHPASSPLVEKNGAPQKQQGAVAQPTTTEAPLSTGKEPGIEPEAGRRSFFREAVDSLADEYSLTRQERRVLLLVAKGLNAGAISEEMVVSVNTAKSHMRNAYAKLDVHSQQEIIALVSERKDRLRGEQGS